MDVSLNCQCVLKCRQVASAEIGRHEIILTLYPNPASFSATVQVATFPKIKRGRMKSIKQVFLFLCAVCAVSLVVGGKLEGQAWQARHNLTPAQFQSTFDDLFKQGYRLKNMSGYISNGE